MAKLASQARKEILRRGFADVDMRLPYLEGLMPGSVEVATQFVQSVHASTKFMVV
jgi:hypothetical protein